MKGKEIIRNLVTVMKEFVDPKADYYFHTCKCPHDTFTIRLKKK